MTFATGKDQRSAPDPLDAKRAVNGLLREYQRAQDDRDSAAARMASFADTARILIGSLSPDDRAEAERRLAELEGGRASQSRGGEVFGKVIELFKSNPRRQWTVPQIQAAMGDADGSVETKALYNALSYLAKTGRLRRIARGQYFVTDVGASVEYDGSEDGTRWGTEHEV